MPKSVNAGYVHVYHSPGQRCNGYFNQPGASQPASRPGSARGGHCTSVFLWVVSYLAITLISISLRTNDAEHLFMCLVVIHRSFFWRNVYSSPLPVSIFVHLFLKDVFIYFIIWPWRVFDTARGLSLVPVSRGYCSSCAGFSRRRWRLSLWSTGAVGACAPAVAVCRLRSCGSWAQ